MKKARLEVVTLLEWAALDTSATFTRRDGDCSSTGETAIVCKERPIAAHAGVTSIEDWYLVDVVGMGKPVPVLARSVKRSILQ
jgi:hypothetical protein